MEYPLFKLLKEKDIFRKAIAHLIEEKTGKKPETFSDEEKRAIESQPLPNPDMPEGFTFQLQLDGQPIQPPEDIQSLMDSIIQDMGLIPEEYLVAAGDGGYKLKKEHGLELELAKKLGDSTQMPGVFILMDGEVKEQFIHRHAAEQPDYEKLLSCCV